MGIDYDGGMIIGEIGCNLDEEKFKELSENGYATCYLRDEKDMQSMPLYYDCEFDCIVFGFGVDDINVVDIDQTWIDGIKEKARLFEEITGCQARLIGCQDIT